MQIRAEATVSQPPFNSRASSADNDEGVTIERVSSSSRVIVPPIQIESDREVVVQSNEAVAKLDRQTKSRSAAQQHNKATQPQTRYKKPTTIVDVSKSIAKSVKSIQRTLASLFN
jgi:prophage tail gpP-like protein